MYVGLYVRILIDGLLELNQNFHLFLIIFVSESKSTNFCRQLFSTRY